MDKKENIAFKALKRFIRFIKLYKEKVVIFLFISLLSVVANVAEGYLVRNIVNSALENDNNEIVYYIKIMALIIIVGIFVAFLTKYIYSLISSNAMMDFRLHLYKHFQKLPVYYFDKEHSGNLLSRFNNDASRVQDFFGHDLFNLFI